MDRQVDSVPVSESREKPPSRMKFTRGIVACLLGNWFELFDFTIYGYFAVQIGKAFFPAHDPTASLLSTFATYGVGFLMRPLGAMMIGSYGDRRGRKSALAMTMLVMALGTGLTGLIPDYATIGIAAPLLLVLCRMLQGFSTGGEWGGATTFIVESAPANRRGLFGSLQQLSTGLASLSAVGTALLLNALIPAPELGQWGWRLPFLLGFAIAPIGYYLRKNVDESQTFEQAKHVRAPLREALGKYRGSVLAVLGLTIIWTVAGYTYGTFTAAFATQTLHMGATAGLMAVIAGSLVNLTTVPIVGILTDRFGAKPFLMASAAGFALLSWPMFQFVAHDRSMVSLLVMTTVAGFLSGLFSGSAPSHLCKILPTHVRYVSLAVGYNGAVMVFGGFAPFIATSLVAVTGLAASPSWYIVACALVSLSVLIWNRAASSSVAQA